MSKQSCTDPTLCTQSRQPCQPSCLFPSVVQTMPPSSQLGSVVDSTKVLQHLWIFLPLIHPCLICLSHHIPFQENLTVLDFAAVALPSSPSNDDLFSRNSNTDLESSACLLVPVMSHHLFLFPSLCQCQWDSFPFLWKRFVLSIVRIFQRPQDLLCPLELSTLDPAWVQRILLLLRKEQLLLSTSGTCPTVTIGVGSVARVPQEEALPTPPS